MKIAVIGYSGSGKSTLAQTLGARYDLPVLHLDTVQWLPGWQERAEDEKLRLVSDFLASHDGWVIDGNYPSLCWERRMAEADRIVLLLLPRCTCLRRAFRRFRQYRGKSRPDMTEGCAEKLDAEFIRWILIGGRKKRTRGRYTRVSAQYADKAVVLRTPRELENYIKSVE